MKMYRWKPEGGVPEVLDIPEDQMDRAMELHGALVEAAAENDDALMEKFFDAGTLTEDEMRAGISAGLFPGVCSRSSAYVQAVIWCVRRTLEFVGNVVPTIDRMEPPCYYRWNSR